MADVVVYPHHQERSQFTHESCTDNRCMWSMLPAICEERRSMTEAKVVYVVVKQEDQGVVALVASSQEKAADYIDKYPYNSFMIVERTVDKAEF